MMLVGVLLIAPLTALAQVDNVVEVPESGYSGTDTFGWRDYLVEVKKPHI